MRKRREHREKALRRLERSAAGLGPKGWPIPSRHFTAGDCVWCDEPFVSARQDRCCSPLCVRELRSEENKARLAQMLPDDLAMLEELNAMTRH